MKKILLLLILAFNICAYAAYAQKPPGPNTRLHASVTNNAQVGIVAANSHTSTFQIINPNRVDSIEVTPNIPQTTQCVSAAPLTIGVSGVCCIIQTPVTKNTAFTVTQNNNQLSISGSVGKCVNSNWCTGLTDCKQ